jgi:predicted AAA+ superfamily ATPase
LYFDFVIYKDRQVNELIQVTLNMKDKKTADREIRALTLAAGELHPVQMTIITLDEREEITTPSGKIRVIPVMEWLTSSGNF